MAQRVTVLLVDDVDGGEAEETVQFALDGVSYEIDLSGKNAEAIREALEPFRKHARRLRGGAHRQSRSLADTKNVTPADRPHIKAFAVREGLPEVSDRGRINGDTLQRWIDAGRPKADAGA